jgi:hypothetical protein
MISFSESYVYLTPVINVSVQNVGELDLAQTTTSGNKIAPTSLPCYAVVNSHATHRQRCTYPD